MFGLNERPYAGCELKSFGCDSANKNFDFFTFQNFSEFFSFVYFGYHQNLLISYTPLLRVFLNIYSMHIGPKEFARSTFLRFSASLAKFKMEICFWCDSDNKNFDFFSFQNFSGYFSFVHLAIIKIW